MPLVSIHAPREGCDLQIDSTKRPRRRFQFTHPGRGATFNRKDGTDGTSGFNSRTPGGVRHTKRKTRQRRELFQFTHPGRGATRRRSRRSSIDASFNSRTPGGVRRLQCRYHWCQESFNSRTPGGVRLSHVGGGEAVKAVSIHAPREGCDKSKTSGRTFDPAFQFTHPGRGATGNILRVSLHQLFQFTHPGRGAT